MQKFGLSAVIALTLAALSYAGLAAFDHDHVAQPQARAAVKRSPQEIAARDHMARLVAEVAARNAAQTAKSVTLSQMRQPPPLQTVARLGAETTASR